MGVYLDKTGLTKVWAKVKEHDTSTLTAAKNYTDTLKSQVSDGTVTAYGATNATNAANANKATNDGDGNKISTTYVKNTALTTTLASYATNDVLTHNYVKKTDFIDADKVDVQAYGQSTTIGQFQGLDEFITLVDSAITDLDNDIKAITALTEAEINSVCV